MAARRTECEALVLWSNFLRASTEYAAGGEEWLEHELQRLRRDRPNEIDFWMNCEYPVDVPGSVLVPVAEIGPSQLRRMLRNAGLDVVSLSKERDN